MTVPGRVLIVDDDRTFREAALQVFAPEGHHLETAATREEALAKLAASEGWDAVILDVKLRGLPGPDDGLDLLADVRAQAPFAPVLLVTGLADEITIEPALSKGAHDYLEKGGRLFWPLLRVKVRAAVDLARERRLASLDVEDREAMLVQLFQDLKTQTTSRAKGAVLEELMLLLFMSTPGFHKVIVNARSGNEEFDLAVANQSEDPLWQREGNLLLVECKNWSKATERRELDAFSSKMRRHGKQCRLGFFVAVGGFSAGFLRERERLVSESLTVVSLALDDLEQLVLAGNGAARNEALKGLYTRALLHSGAAR